MLSLDLIGLDLTRVGYGIIATALGLNLVRSPMVMDFSRPYLSPALFNHRPVVSSVNRHALLAHHMASLTLLTWSLQPDWVPMPVTYLCAGINSLFMIWHRDHLGQLPQMVAISLNLGLGVIVNWAVLGFGTPLQYGLILGLVGISIDLFSLVRSWSGPAYPGDRTRKLV